MDFLSLSRHLEKYAASALKLLHFTNWIIGNPLASRTLHRFDGSLFVRSTKGRMVIVAEIEFREVAVQMLFVAVLNRRFLFHHRPSRDDDQTDGLLAVMGQLFVGFGAADWLGKRTRGSPCVRISNDVSAR